MLISIYIYIYIYIYTNIYIYIYELIFIIIKLHTTYDFLNQFFSQPMVDPYTYKYTQISFPNNYV